MKVYFEWKIALVPTWYATADDILSNEQIKQELDLCLTEQYPGGQKLY